jgi:hypothetical protein
MFKTKIFHTVSFNNQVNYSSFVNMSSYIQNKNKSTYFVSKSTHFRIGCNKVLEMIRRLF